MLMFEEYVKREIITPLAITLTDYNLDEIYKIKLIMSTTRNIHYLQVKHNVFVWDIPDLTRQLLEIGWTDD